jgi:hypothetical protein
VDDDLTLNAFLGSLKDRVRFSVEVSERNYGGTVAAVLKSLGSSGYEVGKALSFWGTGRGRHNGLNVTLTTPAGHLVEVQFPTPRSRQVGKLTHQLYKRVRNPRFTPEDRVEAFLLILRANRHSRMALHQPPDLHVLAQTTRLTYLDTGLDTWISKNEPVWRRYLEALEASGRSLETELARHNLQYGDVFGSPPENGQQDGRR